MTTTKLKFHPIADLFPLMEGFIATRPRPAWRTSHHERA